MYYFLSILVGILPESIFFTLFFIFTKKISTRKWILFTGIFVVYLSASIVLMFTPWKNFILIFGLWAIARYVYKAEPIDIFLIMFGMVVMMFLDLLCFIIIQNYWIALIVDRICLVGILIFIKNQGNKFYSLYRELWNRRDDKRTRSITIRSVSFITLNIALCALMAIAMECTRLF